MKKIIFFLLFISSIVYGQNGVKVDLSNPNSTLYTMDYFLQPDSYNVARAATTIKGLPKKDAQDKAVKIKEILDGKGLKLDFAKIPTNTDYVDSTGYRTRTSIHNKNRYAPFPLRLPSFYLEKKGKNWYFSAETLDQVDKVYDDTFSVKLTWLEKKYPEFFQTKALGFLIWKPLAVLFVLIISVLLFYILEPLIFGLLKYLQKLMLKRSTNEIAIKNLHELAKPLAYIIILNYIKEVLPSIQLVDFNEFLLTGIKVAETVIWVFVFLKLVKVVLNLYHGYNEESKSRLDKQLEPILNKIIQFVVVLMGFLHVLTVFGVDPTAVLAGASIGGIAVAFAAQDSVKNFIGTMVIFMDKPFQLDDWISFGSVEGAVEKVGFRSTIIRASDTTVFQIPNSKIAEADINNIGLRIYRRYKSELGIRYDTPPELIEAFIDGIKKIIAMHPSTKSQAYNVDFIAFGDSSLKILVNVYFKGLDWGQEQESKHILHMAVIKLAATLGVEFAFPSSTLMIEELPGQTSGAPKYVTDKKETDKKIEKLMDSFTNRDLSMDPNASTERGGGD